MPLRHRALAVGLLALAAIPLSLLAVQPHPCGTRDHLAAQQLSADFIIDADTPAKATANRVLIEQKTGVVQLPLGKITFDRAPALRSGVTLEGPATLSQQYKGDEFPLNATLATAGSGMGHVHTMIHDGRSAWVGSAVADKCPKGTLVYTFVYDGYALGPGQRNRRHIVTERAGSVVRLDSPIDPLANRLKWFSDASPIADVQEGATSVATTRGEWTVGQSVLVTSGASIANEANGELRTVRAVAGNVVTLDRPLRRGYALAALARVATVDNVTLRDLTIELPLNTASECLYASLCRNWRIERCTIRKTVVGNCSDIRFTDCDLGGAQAAASSHDITFSGCRIGSVNFEEGCHDLLIDGSRLGPVSANMNCVTMNAQSERLTVRHSTFLGGIQPCSQILMFGPGRECAFESIVMAGKAPCWLKGDRMRLAAVISDGDISVTGADPSRFQVWANNGRWNW